MSNNCLVVLNYKDYETTKTFIENIKGYKSIDNIVVVDNASNDGSYEKLLEYKSQKIHIVKSETNRGYSCGNNIGIKYAISNLKCKYIIISNPDVWFDDNVIYKMTSVYKKYDNIGIVAPKMIQLQGNPICAWKIPTWGKDLFCASDIIVRLTGNLFSYKEDELNNEINFVDALPGSFFMIKADVLEKINFLDESVFLYCEEDILAHKLKSINYKNILLGKETFMHEHSVSINKNISSKIDKYKILYSSKIIYHKKYNKINNIQLVISNITYRVAIMEKIIILWISKIMNKIKSKDKKNVF